MIHFGHLKHWMEAIFLRQSLKIVVLIVAGWLEEGVDDVKDFMDMVNFLENIIEDRKSHYAYN